MASSRLHTADILTALGRLDDAAAAANEALTALEGVPARRIRSSVLRARSDIERRRGNAKKAIEVARELG